MNERQRRRLIKREKRLWFNRNLDLIKKKFPNKSIKVIKKDYNETEFETSAKEFEKILKALDWNDKK